MSTWQPSSATYTYFMPLKPPVIEYEWGEPMYYEDEETMADPYAWVNLCHMEDCAVPHVVMHTAIGTIGVYEDGRVYLHGESVTLVGKEYT